MREKVEEKSTTRKVVVTGVEVQAQTTYTGKKVEAEQATGTTGQMIGRIEDFLATADPTVEVEATAGRIHGGQNSVTQE